ncbi:MAG TPA: hypothetical protein VJP80_02640 [Candidatus Saccharimonadales bacterium]|nr:hypothetical protein [Candidatus Saccharimonadales bacterium]
MSDKRNNWLAAVYPLLFIVALLLGFIVRAAPGSDTLPPYYTPGTTGYDVSWPNCNSQLSRLAAWGVVGVTGGLVFHANPCLEQESTWFRAVSLYVNTGYPGGSRAAQFATLPRHCAAHDERCLAYNYGYNAGLYSVRLASKYNIHAAWWWLDVETENSWSDDPYVNRESLVGMIDAIKRQTVFARVGFYSYPGQWALITGNWAGENLPAWAATGSRERGAAIAACKAESFTGGPLMLTQYTATLDRNYVC